MDVSDAAELHYELRSNIQLEEAEHLGVAVLLDNINALVLLDEFVDFAREWERTDAEVINFKIVFFAELIA